MAGVDWGAIAGSIKGGIGSRAQAKNTNANIQRNYEFWKKMLNKALGQLDDKKLLATIQAMWGGKFEQGMASSLSQAGTLNSPMGTALMDAARSAPSAMAAGQAIDYAKLRAQIISAQLGSLPTRERKNVMAEAMLGSAKGYAGAGIGGSSAMPDRRGTDTSVAQTPNQSTYSTGYNQSRPSADAGGYPMSGEGMGGNVGYNYPSASMSYQNYDNPYQNWINNWNSKTGGSSWD